MRDHREQLMLADRDHIGDNNQSRAVDEKDNATRLRVLCLESGICGGIGCRSFGLLSLSSFVVPSSTCRYITFELFVASPMLHS